MVKVKKECPFCLNEIDEDLKECPFCEEMLNEKEKIEEAWVNDVNKKKKIRNKKTIKPDEKWIYHCPKCWSNVRRWYTECTNCWCKLERSEEDIVFAKNDAQKKAVKWMNFSSIIAFSFAFLSAISFFSLWNPKISYLTGKIWIQLILWVQAVLYAVLWVCMLLRDRNRIAFILCFLVFIFDVINRIINWTYMSGSWLIFRLFCCYVFFRWIRSSIDYRNIMWKKNLSIDEWLLLVVWGIAILFIMIWFIANQS